VLSNEISTPSFCWWRLLRQTLFFFVARCAVMFSRYSLMHVWEWDERISVNPARWDNNNLMHRGSGLRTFFPLMLLMPLIAVLLMLLWCEIVLAALFWLRCKSKSRDVRGGWCLYYFFSHPAIPQATRFVRVRGDRCLAATAWEQFCLAQVLRRTQMPPPLFPN
jgi:hypothetical protein